MTVRRAVIPQLALDLRHVGELLIGSCDCATRTHRWRYSPCTYRLQDPTDPKVTYPCINGHITRGPDVTDCPECWICCSGGHYFDPETGDLRPCPLCKPHTLGEHLDRQADTLRPGPRAANTDPGSGNRWEDADDGSGEKWPVPKDPAGEAAINPIADSDHGEWQHILHQIQRWQRKAHDYIGSHRPDRRPTAEDPATDAEYCSWHLATIGTCEPRYRADLCQTCYRFELTYDIKPPRVLLEVRQEGKRWHQGMVDQAVRAAKPLKPAKGKRRKRAS